MKWWSAHCTHTLQTATCKDNKRWKKKLLVGHNELLYDLYFHLKNCFKTYCLVKTGECCATTWVFSFISVSICTNSAERIQIKNFSVFIFLFCSLSLFFNIPDNNKWWRWVLWRVMNKTETVFRMKFFYFSFRFIIVFAILCRCTCARI